MSAAVQSRLYIKTNFKMSQLKVRFASKEKGKEKETGSCFGVGIYACGFFVLVKFKAACF